MPTYRHAFVEGASYFFTVVTIGWLSILTTDVLPTDCENGFNGLRCYDRQPGKQGRGWGIGDSPYSRYD